MLAVVDVTVDVGVVDGADDAEEDDDDDAEEPENHGGYVVQEAHNATPALVEVIVVVDVCAVEVVVAVETEVLVVEMVIKGQPGAPAMHVVVADEQPLSKQSISYYGTSVYLTHIGHTDSAGGYGGRRRGQQTA